MRDNITILIKRAKNYINEDGSSINGITDYILEYGEFLYLEDLNYLVIGDGRAYETQSEAQSHTTQSYWSGIRQLENGKWVGGSALKELIIDHEYFTKVTSSKLYGDATLEKDIPLTSDNNLIANTKFVQGLTAKKITEALAGVKATIDGAPSKGNTVTAFSQTNGKVYIKFEPIAVSYDNITDGTTTKVPIPSNNTPSGLNKTGHSGTSTKYAREDHVHPIANAGSGRKPVYFSNGNPWEVGSIIDVNISGSAAYAENFTTSAGQNGKPVYIYNGKPKQCADILDVSITGNAATASKFGTSSIGANDKPVYVDRGEIKACNNTLTVNINGNATSCSGTASIASQLSTNRDAGTNGKPVYFSNGVPVQCADTLSVNVTGNAGSASKLGTGTTGSSTKPIYLSDGVPTQCSDTLGNNISGTAATVNSQSGNNFYITGVKAASGQMYYNTAVSVNSNNVLLGAAWNDIAEFREGRGTEGQCVCEDGKGKLIPSSKHLQKCSYIVSDTYGFAIGETEKCKLPIAISGRVLAHTKQDLRVGDVVCAGKSGCVEKMNRLEIILFPDRILGIVSEVPTYDVWNDKVKVHNRVWISIK